MNDWSYPLQSDGGRMFYPNYRKASPLKVFIILLSKGEAHEPKIQNKHSYQYVNIYVSEIIKEYKILKI